MRRRGRGDRRAGAAGADRSRSRSATTSSALSASLGIAYGQAESTASSLLRDADVAMYQAKTTGRAGGWSTSRRCGSPPSSACSSRTTWPRPWSTTSSCSSTNPSSSCETNRIVGFEALLRWQHPELGLVMPDAFIPLAEENGMIIPIGRWVLQTACDTAAEWLERYPGELTMGVNLSARQLASSELVSDVQDGVGRGGLPAGALVLEMTETVLVQDAALGRGPAPPAARPRGAPGHRRLRDRATRRSATCASSRSTSSRSTRRSSTRSPTADASRRSCAACSTSAAPCSWRSSPKASRPRPSSASCATSTASTARATCSPGRCSLDEAELLLPDDVLAPNLTPPIWAGYVSGRDSYTRGLRPRSPPNWAGFVSGRDSSRKPRRFPPRSPCGTNPAQFGGGVSSARRVLSGGGRGWRRPRRTWRRVGRRRRTPRRPRRPARRSSACGRRRRTRARRGGGHRRRARPGRRRVRPRSSPTAETAHTSPVPSSSSR